MVVLFLKKSGDDSIDYIYILGCEFKNLVSTKFEVSNGKQ